MGFSASYHVKTVMGCIDKWDIDIFMINYGCFDLLFLAPVPVKDYSGYTPPPTNVQHAKPITLLIFLITVPIWPSSHIVSSLILLDMQKLIFPIFTSHKKLV